MPEWVATLLGVAVAALGGVIGFTIAQDRRITRLEERVHGVGTLLQKLPKRKGDGPSD